MIKLTKSYKASSRQQFQRNKRLRRQVEIACKNDKTKGAIADDPDILIAERSYFSDDNLIGIHA